MCGGVPNLRLSIVWAEMERVSRPLPQPNLHRRNRVSVAEARQWRAIGRNPFIPEHFP